MGALVRAARYVLAHRYRWLVMAISLFVVTYVPIVPYTPNCFHGDNDVLTGKLNYKFRDALFEHFQVFDVDFMWISGTEEWASFEAMLRRACSIIPRLRSRPTTRQPSLSAMSNATSPVPVHTSSTFAVGATSI